MSQGVAYTCSTLDIGNIMLNAVRQVLSHPGFPCTATENYKGAQIQVNCTQPLQVKACVSP